MQTIEFIGIRGGHGTTTVALAAAATLAARGPTRISTHDRCGLCAIVGISNDEPIINLAGHLDLTAGEADGDVIDAGTLERYFGPDPFTAELAARPQRPPGAMRIGVLRGPDYLGVRTLCEHPGAPLDGLVVVSEAGRALDARDVEHVSGRPVVAVVDHTAVVARTIDGGLLLPRLARLGEFAQLRTWITQIAPKETPCAAVA